MCGCAAWTGKPLLFSKLAKRVRAELIEATADGPDVIGAAHFPFGHVITVNGEHQFRLLE